MKKLIMCYGLQASGKTTWAKEQVLKSGGNTKRVNKDDLRSLIDAGKWSKSNEKSILKARDLLIRMFLATGFSVIVDDTNLAGKHKETLGALAKEFDAIFEIKKFDISLEEAIKRDLQRPNSVGEKVIKETYNQFLKPKQEVYTPPKGRADAIQIDIDGCLAFGHFGDIGRRKPYDWDRVGEDDPNPQVVNLVRKYYPTHHVILLSGRDSICRSQTEQWLDKNEIPYHKLYMRAEGDARKDTVVKKELFEEHIRNNYQVQFVVDDRPSVCRLWRSLGLPLFAVGDQDVDF